METVFCEDIPLDRNSEYYEFSIGKASELRCAQGSNNLECGECETCLLSYCVLSTRNWYWRCSHQVQKHFLTGLIQRFQSVDLLKYTIQLLKPLISKDFTYARSRTRPGLNIDTAQSSSNRALSMNDIETSIKHTWNWFSASNYWTKSNYLLELFKMTDTHLLFLIGNQAKTMLSSEIEALNVKDQEYEDRAASQAAMSRYSSVEQRPHTAPEMIKSRLSRSEMVFDASDDEIDDPTINIRADSEKALVGVTRYKDFVKDLPVHLSKFILGFLDEATLFNCSKVSRHWNVLVDEMRAEFYANQQMWEDIMLMQGSSGVIPNYANDIDILVPNVNPDTLECIKLKSSPDPKTPKEERFKSEMNFVNAYTGYSTRKVIMEERNLYCGSYNVLVLVNETNSNRVVNTCGGKYLAFSKSKRCHLIDISTGRDTEHPIAGHSGSIKCVNIQESAGFVLTGSFDTSIRKWDLATLKCVKIFNGHQDTIVSLDYCDKSKQFASASLDNSCKVWYIDSKKCYRTFKHRSKVLAAVLSEVLCITGCEKGRVKVWNIESGSLIKMLLGHDKQISAIRFDKWHILTSSHDGYVLVWSNQGNHKRCLSALRHPCAVTSMEFMYLRAITGAEDGRVRIWNVVNGQCCRIMRGNSQSDPILGLYAIGDKLTINTKTNVLMLTFESIEWDYSHESDKKVSLVDHNKYQTAPLRQHAYPYIRAQRMAATGSADPRLVKKDEKPRFTRTTSARSSSSSFSKGSQKKSCDGQASRPSQQSPGQESEATINTSPKIGSFQEPKKCMSASNITAFDVSGMQKQDALDKRRVSWAFQHPDIPSCEQPSLDEIKALLKKQIRNSVKTPDFVYLTISALKSQVVSSYPYEYSNNQDFPKRPHSQGHQKAIHKPILKFRPQSSPSSYDTKAKVVIAENLQENMKDRRNLSSGKRPSTANSTVNKEASETEKSFSGKRSQSARSLKVISADSPDSTPAPNMRISKSSGNLEERYHRLTTTATEINIVPMLMYPKEGLKPNINNEAIRKWSNQTTIAQNHPINPNKTLKLRTYSQETALMSELKSN